MEVVGSCFTVAATTTDFRIDHNEIDGYPAAAVFGYGELKYGVIDSNYIEDCSGECFYIKGDGNDAWADGGAGGSYTDGTVYIEDNIIDLIDSNGSNLIDTGGGARWVFRYNTVKETGGYYGYILEAHGHYWGERDGPDNAGTYLQEVYENTFIIGDDRDWGQILRSRGGITYFYNNTINDDAARLSAMVVFWNKEASNPGATCEVAAHADYYGGTAHGVSFDGECQTADHPCPLQVNNSYIWGNTDDANNTVLTSQGAETIMVEDRDWWDDVGAGDTNFTTGTATVAGACSDDDAYFETDTGILSRCDGANNWTTIYTQYAYPHPFKR